MQTLEMTSATVAFRLRPSVVAMIADTARGTDLAKSYRSVLHLTEVCSGPVSLRWEVQQPLGMTSAALEIRLRVPLFHLYS
jgi:hypothetical protein